MLAATEMKSTSILACLSSSLLNQLTLYLREYFYFYIYPRADWLPQIIL